MLNYESLAALKAFADGAPPKIVEGIVIGVTAGIFLKLIDFIGNRFFYRKEQIRYVQGLFEKSREQIYSCKTFPHPNPQKPDVAVHDIRWEFYKKLRVDVLSALRERCACMSYDQTYTIKKAFHILEFLGEQERKATLQIYKRFFNELEAVRWLRLPPKEPDADAEE